MVNEVPVEYFCTLDASGRRIDLHERPELCSGSVEYVAPAEYMVGLCLWNSAGRVGCDAADMVGLPLWPGSRWMRVPQRLKAEPGGPPWSAVPSPKQPDCWEPDPNARLAVVAAAGAGAHAAHLRVRHRRLVCRRRLGHAGRGEALSAFGLKCRLGECRRMAACCVLAGGIWARVRAAGRAEAPNC